MKRKLVLLTKKFQLFVFAIFLSTTIKAQLSNSYFEGKGDFIMVGNVNHNMIYDESKEENAQNLYVVDTDNNPLTYNSSSAEICIPANVCEGDGIVGAFLSWSGKVNNVDSISKCSTVLVSLDGGTTYTTVTSTCEITQEVDGNTDPKGFYVCHADILNEFNQFIAKGGNFEHGIVYVGNIVSEYLYSSTSPSRFSGWTLTIIYQNSDLSEVSIKYIPKQTFTYGSANGKVGKDLFDNIDFSDNGNSYRGIGDVRLGLTIVGGYKKETEEKLYVGVADSAKLISSDFRVSGLFDTSEKANYLSNTIQNYTCEQTTVSGYTRGYDIHVHELYKENPKGKFLNAGDNHLNLLLTHNSEHHLLTDVVVELGLPQPHQIEAVQKVSGDSCLNYVIDINTGENVEDLDNFQINIQLPDYTNKITDFKITGTLLDNYYKSKVSGEYAYHAFGINQKAQNNVKYRSTDRSNGYFVCTDLAKEKWRYSTDSTLTEKAIQSRLNSIVENADSTNMNLMLSFSGSIPKDLQNQTILTVEYTVCLNTDPYAEKSAMTGEEAEIASQSQLSMSGHVSHDSTVVYSNEESVLNALEKCESFLNIGGGGGGIGGGSGGSGGGSGSGVDERNGQPSVIRNSFTFKCNEIPDSVHIDGCLGDTFPIQIIEQLLLKEHNVDMEKLRKKDTVRWMELKRDSLVNLCQLAIQSLVEKRDFIQDGCTGIVCSDSSNWYLMKQYWESVEPLSSYNWQTLFDTLTYKFRLDSDFLENQLHPQIDAIVNRPFAVTHLDYRLNVNTDWLISRNGTTDTVIPIKKADYMVSFVTPYKYSGSAGTSASSCRDEFVVSVNPEVVVQPHLYKGTRFIAYGDTVQYCLEANVDTFTLVTKKKNYEIEPIDSALKVDYLEYELLSDTVYRYVPRITTETMKIDSFKVVQRNNTGCVSDTFLFYIQVLDVKPTLKPLLPTDSIVCVTDLDSLELTVVNESVVDSMRLEGFNLAWYLIDDSKSHNDSLIVKDVVSIKVPKDSIGIYGYGVSFYFLGCETEMDTFKLEVKGLPAKLKSPDLSFCQYVEADSAFVVSQIEALNGTGLVHTLPYHHLVWFDSTRTLLSLTDTMALPTLLSTFDYSVCGEKWLSVAPVSEYGCLGDSTHISLQVICYDSLSPSFKNNVDSVLYCVGDHQDSIGKYIETSLYDENVQWVWYPADGTIPTNTLNPLELGAVLSKDNQLIRTNTASEKEYVLVRVDSNRCVSRPSKFKVVVGDSIQSVPLIGDTIGNKYYDADTKKVTLRFCQSNSIYYKDYLPMKSSVDGYRLEWVKKMNDTDDCDTLRKYSNEVGYRNDKIHDNVLVDFNHVGTEYYCVRQSTQVGCKGPWVQLSLTTHKSVDEIPTPDTVVLCQNEPEVKISCSYQANDSTLKLAYFDSAKKEIGLDSAYIHTDMAGEFTTAYHNNQYYVSYMRYINEETKCLGELVGVESYIKPKPTVPQVLNDTLYYCRENNEFAHLVSDGGVSILPGISTPPSDAELDKRLEWATSLDFPKWTERDSFETNEPMSATYYVRSKYYFIHSSDTSKECVSDVDSIHVIVDKTFDYTPIDSFSLCYGDTVDLWTMVEESIVYPNAQDQLIKNPKVSFHLRRLNQSKELKQEEAESICSVASEATQESIQRYELYISDSVSGCMVKDTLVVRFAPLPVLKEIPSVQKCQDAQFVLPTPFEDATTYRWQYSNGLLIADSTYFVLNEEHTNLLGPDSLLSLIASTSDGCVDSIHLHIIVDSIPDYPLVRDTSFCQYTHNHVLFYDKNASVNSSNLENDLVFHWENNQHVRVNSFNSDTAFSTEKIEVTYYGVVKNIHTGCTNSQSITVSVLQQIQLGIDDPAPLCQPESFNGVEYIHQYIDEYGYRMGGVSPQLDGYFIIQNGGKDSMSFDQMSQLTYHSSSDKIEYGYRMVDSKNVCITEDTFELTIYPKPVAPMIGSGLDTLFLCSGSSSLSVEAFDTVYAKNLQFVWQDGSIGDTYLLSEPLTKLSVYFQDTITSCTSDKSFAVASVSSPISVMPMGTKDTLLFCGDTLVDLWSLALKSFKVDKKSRSFLTMTAKKGNNVMLQSQLENLTSTVQDTSTYVFTISDTLTGCSASNQVTVIFYQLPQFSVVGEKEICYQDNISLKVADDNRPISFQWLQDSVLVSTGFSYQQSAVEKDSRLTVIGSLNDLPSCKSSVTHFIVVDTLPTSLNDTAIYICQDTTATPVSLTFNRNKTDIRNYSIRWYNSVGDTLQVDKDALLHSITQEGVVIYNIDLQDRNTGCVSEKSRMTVTVNPQIKSLWSNPDTICSPATYNLLDAFSGKIVGGTQPKYQFSIDEVGDTVRNETSISNNSKWKVYFKDEAGCEMIQPVSIQFYSEPSAPSLVGDTIVCQGIGDVTFSAQKNGANTLHQTFVWKGSGREEQSDKLVVPTLQAGSASYELIAVDTLTHCHSSSVPFTLDIRKKIEYEPVGLIESCYQVDIDLPNHVEAHYLTNDDDVTYSYYQLSPSDRLTLVPDPTRVQESGKYIVQVHEKISQCNRQDTIEVVVYDSIGVSIKGETTICYGDTVPDLMATHADTYRWRRGNLLLEGADFPFATDVKESETFRLIGEKKLGTLYCQDSIDVYVQVNANPFTLQDTTLRFCQSTTGTTEQVYLSTYSTSGEPLQLKWYDANQQILFDDREVGSIPVDKDTTLIFYLKQVNNTTGCESSFSTVQAIIYPKIEILLPDSATCQPQTIDLLKIAKQSVYAKELTSLIETDAVTYVDNADADVTDHATQLSESGLYKVQCSYTVQNLHCQASDFSTLTFYSQPIVPTVESQSFCQHTGDHLLKGTASETNLKLIWENISSVPSSIDTISSVVSTDIEGVRYYNVRQVQNHSNCVSRDTMIKVTIYPEVLARLYQYDECDGIPVYINDIVQKYNIQDEISSLYNLTSEVAFTSIQHEMNQSGVYTFVAKNTQGCKSTDTLNLQFHKPENVQITGSNRVYCYGENLQLEVTTNNPCDFEWRSENETLYVEACNCRSSHFAMPIYEIDSLSVVAKESAMGCESEYTFPIKVRPKINPIISGNTTICNNQLLKLYSSTNYTNVEWVYHDTIVDQSSVFVHSAAELKTNQEDEYEVKLKVVDRNNCKDSVTQMITIYEYVSPFIIAENADVVWANNNTDDLDLKHPVMNFSSGPLVSNHPLSYRWWVTDSTITESEDSLFYNYEFTKEQLSNCQDQLVYLEVTVAGLCSDTTSKLLTVRCDPFVPNSYVANGENIFMDGYDLQIFDRVGTLIYEANQREGWNGTYRGESLASEDTYYYVLRYYVHGEEKVKTGYVTLAREN